ncbi:MAG: hypothetical protein KGK07_07235 [Chloroflexota bacterium]|nr:hypothetical protein [Chloroflexota bacterium]
MSLNIALTVDGDLEHPAARDLAEHVVRLVREAVQGAAAQQSARVDIAGPHELRSTTERRAFNAPEEFRADSDGPRRAVEFSAYIHLPKEGA